MELQLPKRPGLDARNSRGESLCDKDKEHLYNFQANLGLPVVNYQGHVADSRLRRCGVGRSVLS